MTVQDIREMNQESYNREHIDILLNEIDKLTGFLLTNLDNLIKEANNNQYDDRNRMDQMY